MSVAASQPISQYGHFTFENNQVIDFWKSQKLFHGQILDIFF